jgi:leader peptidase (prepilin peptidase)/N-methyltransferase
MLPIAGVYGLLCAMSRGKWIGFGDVKLGVIIGLLLSWQGGVTVLFLANLLGTLVILPVLLTGKMMRGDKFPFGPMLIAATVIVFLCGQQILTLARDWLLLS